MFTWITSVIHQTGAVGVFLLMTLENVFPPLPSELIMPMAGYVAAGHGGMFLAVVLAGTAGSAVGAVLWYAIGRWLGLERLQRWASSHGRWLTLSPRELAQATEGFRRWGVAAVLVGRTLPGVRGVICIPAGVFPGTYEEIARLLVPELQRRNLFRQNYAGKTLRENLQNPN